MVKFRSILKKEPKRPADGLWEMKQSKESKDETSISGNDR